MKLNSHSPISIRFFILLRNSNAIFIDLDLYLCVLTDI